MLVRVGLSYSLDCAINLRKRPLRATAPFGSFTVQTLLDSLVQCKCSFQTVCCRTRESGRHATFVLPSRTVSARFEMWKWVRYRTTHRVPLQVQWWISFFCRRAWHTRTLVIRLIQVVWRTQVKWGVSPDINVLDATRLQHRIRRHCPTCTSHVGAARSWNLR